MPWITIHEHKIEEKSTKSSQSSSKVVGLGPADLWEFPTLVGCYNSWANLRSSCCYPRGQNYCETGLLPPCSGKQMWIWCSVVSSPAWWLITPSPISEAARCQLLLRAEQLRHKNVSARKLSPKLQCQEMINVIKCFSNKLHNKSMSSMQSFQ